MIISAFLILASCAKKTEILYPTEFRSGISENNDAETKKLLTEKNIAENQGPDEIAENDNLSQEEVRYRAKVLWNRAYHSIEYAKRLKGDEKDAEIESAIENLGLILNLPGELPEKLKVVQTLLVIGAQYPSIAAGKPASETNQEKLSSQTKKDKSQQRLVPFEKPASHYRFISRMNFNSLAVSLSWAKARAYDKILLRAIEEYGLPRGFSSKEQFLVFALTLFYIESNISPHAVSPADAMGIAQIIPGTARMELGMEYKDSNDEYAAFKPETAIRAFVKHIHRLANHFDGFEKTPKIYWELIGKSYNAGYGTVKTLMLRYGSDNPVLWASKKSKYHRTHRRCKGRERVRWLDRKRFCLARVEPIETAQYTLKLIHYSFLVERIWKEVKPSDLRLKKIVLPAPVHYLDLDKRGDLYKVFARKVAGKIAPTNCLSIRCFAPHRKKTFYSAGEVIMVPELVFSEVKRAINIAASRGPLPRYESYFVKKGDTVSGIIAMIRKKYHSPVSRSEFKKINRIGRFIYPGQRLKIPIYPSFDKKSEAKQVRYGIMSLKKAETWDSISKSLRAKGYSNNTSAELRKINKKNLELKYGTFIRYRTEKFNKISLSKNREQRSQLPKYVNILVRKNMTFWSLSRRWDVPVKKLLDINKGKDLIIGKTVKIPIRYRKIKEAKMPDLDPRRYASALGLKGKRWRQLLDLNNTDRLIPGRMIKIPVY